MEEEIEGRDGGCRSLSAKSLALPTQARQVSYQLPGLIAGLNKQITRKQTRQLVPKSQAKFEIANEVYKIIKFKILG